MGNLGGYQTMTTAAKKVGGPDKLVVIVLAAGYVLFRTAEAGVKQAVRAVKERGAPCPTKGEIFQVTADGDYRDLTVRADDEYEVLECDGEAILIELRGRPGNPYFVPAEFLRSVSSFPAEDAARRP